MSLAQQVGCPAVTRAWSWPNSNPMTQCRPSWAPHLLGRGRPDADGWPAVHAVPLCRLSQRLLHHSQNPARWAHQQLHLPAMLGANQAAAHASYASAKAGKPAASNCKPPPLPCAAQGVQPGATTCLLHPRQCEPLQQRLLLLALCPAPASGALCLCCELVVCHQRIAALHAAHAAGEPPAPQRLLAVAHLRRQEGSFEGL